MSEPGRWLVAQAPCAAGCFSREKRDAAFPARSVLAAVYAARARNATAGKRSKWGKRGGVRVREAAAASEKK
jgi:hypothetical protein